MKTLTGQYSISAGTLSATVAAHGAELQTLSHENHGELLWSGDPSVWAGRSPLLFPIVGGLVDNRYRYQGKDYELPRHGFARKTKWELLEHSSYAVTFRLEANAETKDVYPFAFQLDMSYVVTAATLTMKAILRNTGDVELPASFGFHPAFIWPSPTPENERLTLVFEKSEPEPVRRLTSAGVLATETYPTPVHENRLVVDDDLFTNDALIFDAPHSRVVSYGVPGEPGLQIAFPAMPQLGIWKKPNAGFLCIEPWAGYADPEDFDGEITEKPGVVLLQPASKHTFSMSISVIDCVPK